MPSTEHARLSASSAERFMKCPGSVKLSEVLPPEDESEYAAEGTAAHELGERCLREEQDTFMYIGQTFYDHEVTPEMCEAVQEYVDYVRSFNYDELEIEHTIDNTGLGPDFGGTSDAVATGEGFLHIFDYKHGAGIAVDIEDNQQLMYYAFGVLRGLGVQQGDDLNVGLTIVQPRAFHADGPIREEWISSDEILEWGENELLPAMARVDTDDTPFDEGDHCRFCPAKLACPNLQENFDELAEGDVDILAALDNDALALQYERIKTAKFYMTAVTKECKKRALACDAVAGTKLVYGKSSRKWKKTTEIDGLEVRFEDAVVDQFGDDAFSDPEVRSPAQIEKLPKGKAFTGAWSYKEKGQPSLVGADDKGEPYDPAAEGKGFAGIATPE